MLYYPRWINSSWLKGSRILETLPHAGPADACRGFRRARSSPVRLEADSIVIAGCLESPILRSPIDVALVDRRPYNLSRSVLDRVLAVAMMNAILGQSVPAARERVHLTTHHSIARVPVESEVGRLNRSENFSGLTPGRSIAGKLVLDNKKEPLFADDLRSRTKLLVDGGPVRSDVIKPPEVEAANLVRVELFRERDATLDHFVLMFVRILVRAMHICLGSILRLRGVGPVHLE